MLSILMLLPMVLLNEVSVGLPLIARSSSIDRIVNSSGHFKLALVEAWELVTAQAIMEQEGRSFAALHGDVSKEGSPGYTSQVLRFQWSLNGSSCVIQCIKGRPFRLVRAWRPPNGQGMLRAEVTLLNSNIPTFQQGQVVRHLKYNYTGVILSSDPVCMSQPQWALHYYGGLIHICVSLL